METRFWTIVLIIVAYSLLVLISFVVSGAPQVFFGLIAMIVNLVVYLMAQSESNVDWDSLYLNAWLVLIMGVIFSIFAVVTSSGYMALLCIVMLIGSVLILGIL